MKARVKMCVFDRKLSGDTGFGASVVTKYKKIKPKKAKKILYDKKISAFLKKKRRAIFKRRKIRVQRYFFSRVFRYLYGSQILLGTL